jgi:hypothetical protein
MQPKWVTPTGTDPPKPRFRHRPRQSEVSGSSTQSDGPIPLFVRCHRVVIEVGAATFALDLHPRLTIISGLAAMERESLVNEIVGALGGTRAGVHLELADRGGRRLAVLRPRGGRHRVVDIDRDADVTHEFAGAGGDIDLLARLGLSVNEARDRMRIGQREMADRPEPDERIRNLSLIDQKVLWAAAENVRRTKRVLETETASTPVEISPQMAAVEDAHLACDDIANRIGGLLDRARAVSGGLVGAAALSALAVRPALAALPLGLLSAAAGHVALLERSLRKATCAEDQALIAAGHQSYLGFQLQRVNGMLSDAEVRKRLTTAASLHEQALIRWKELTSTVDVSWAFEHQDDIMIAALLDRELDQHDGRYASLRGALGATLAHALAARLSEARRTSGPDGTLPLLLDEPFAGVDGATKPALLGLLANWSGNPQVVLITDDPDVHSWAQAESVYGELGLVEASPVAQPDAVLI